MEKIVCALWASQGETAAAFGARLLRTLPDALQAAGALQVRINISDARVERAEALRQRTHEPDAAAQFWLPSANAIFRKDIDKALADHSGRFAAWQVAESTIIPNTAHQVEPGQPCFGWSQASFIAFREDMTWDEAVAHWHGHHTQVAIDTQSNFEYVQNIIVRALTPGAPDYDAFVEECFPPEAMTDPAALLDAVGDEARFARNEKAMMDSCFAFLDFSRHDIVPTSQYNFADPA